MAKIPASEKAQQLLANPKTIFLETRCTGFGDYSEIIEIIITNNKGAPIFHSLVNPSIPFSDAILEKYQIDHKKLQKAPIWKDVLENIKFLLMNKPVIVYNSRLDGRLIKQSCRAYTEKTPKWVDDLDFHCVMKMVAEHYDNCSNEYGVVTITQACEDAGISYSASPDIRKKLERLNY